MTVFAITSSPWTHESGTALYAETRAIVAPPAGWGETLRLGISDGLGGAASFKTSVPTNLRYQYLAGGAATGQGWRTWNDDGAFVAHYVAESRAQDTIPVFSYYMLLQSKKTEGLNERAQVLNNLADRNTMSVYFDDLEQVFRQAALDEQIVVLHVEPDLWGFIQQHELQSRGLRARVDMTAVSQPEQPRFSNDSTGFAQAIVALRNTIAPNVLLGYHLSTWGTGEDLLRAKPSEQRVQELANSSAAFYDQLGAPFDLLVSEFSDRDAGFKEHVYGDRGGSWWRDADHRRFAQFLAQVSGSTRLPIVLWQIPVGNTRMRAMNNTWGHYQDNLVETLLDETGNATLQQYLDAGVIGLLFGAGAAGATCYCDATFDGTTNPAPINGNTLESINPDDDGGFFRSAAKAHFARGGMRLPVRT
ncbi:MAG: hypothetical protein ACKVVP_18110 [Chloroflexota bacterium]